MATYHCELVFNIGDSIWKKNEVLLDNQSNISIIHRDMCSNIRELNNTVNVGGAGGNMLNLYETGDFHGFGSVYIPEHWRVNILCFAEVSDIYDISYDKDIGFTVHMPHQDIIFYRKNNFYVANMADWCRATYMLNNVATDSTEAERIGKFSKNQLNLAIEARNLIANAGYPSASEAIKMVNSGNLLNCNITSADIERAIYIWGLYPEYMRGKMTKSKASHIDVDLTIQHRIKNQAMLLDIMQINGVYFAIGLVVPLQLLMSQIIKSERTTEIKNAIESMLIPLYNNGYTINTIYTEPNSPMLALKTEPMGVRIESCGAGDHLDALDVRIRRIKETFRCCIAALEFNLPDNKIQDLVTYCVKRANARSTSSKGNDVAPIVEFTGRKIIYNKDMCMRFGTYCEIYISNHRIKGKGGNPGSQTSPNNVFTSRSHPAIALYPTGNGYGSWYFWDLTTNANVIRSNWKVMVMSDLIRQRIKQIYESKKNNTLEITEDINTLNINNIEEIIENNNINIDASDNIEIQVGNINEEITNGMFSNSSKRKP